jgi:hypothetical protein
LQFYSLLFCALPYYIILFYIILFYTLLYSTVHDRAMRRDSAAYDSAGFCAFHCCIVLDWRRTYRAILSGAGRDGRKKAPRLGVRGWIVKYRFLRARIFYQVRM